MVYKRRLFIILTLAVFATFGFNIADAPKASINLHDEPLAFYPKEFYVSGVKDESKDKTAVASLIQTNTTALSSDKVINLNFEKGTAQNVSAFISRNLPADKSLRPVQIIIRKLKVDETTGGKGIITGHGTISLSFEYNRDEDDTVHLIDYNAGITYSRPSAQYQDAEPVLRHLLENGITYFNTWINKQADGNINLAKGVALSFSDYADDQATDSVFYNSKRPLKWSDFTTGFQSHKYDAEVFPVMGYDEETAVVKGIVQVHILLKTYLAKESALVKDGAQNDYVLNHEQRHFNIAKIAAERFKKRLQQTALPVSNYDGFINVYYLDAYREMHNMQEQYDNETAHGTDHPAQSAWDKRIDDELKQR